jgi:hypothetical protein
MNKFTIAAVLSVLALGTLALADYVSDQEVWAPPTQEDIMEGYDGDTNQWYYMGGDPYDPDPDEEDTITIVKRFYPGPPLQPIWTVEDEWYFFADPVTSRVTMRFDLGYPDAKKLYYEIRFENCSECHTGTAPDYASRIQDQWKKYLVNEQGDPVEETLVEQGVVDESEEGDLPGPNTDPYATNTGDPEHDVPYGSQGE